MLADISTNLFVYGKYLREVCAFIEGCGQGLLKYLTQAGRYKPKHSAALHSIPNRHTI